MESTGQESFVQVGTSINCQTGFPSLQEDGFKAFSWPLLCACSLLFVQPYSRMTGCHSWVDQPSHLHSLGCSPIWLAPFRYCLKNVSHLMDNRFIYTAQQSFQYLRWKTVFYQKSHKRHSQKPTSRQYIRDNAHRYYHLVALFPEWSVCTLKVLSALKAIPRIPGI